MEIDIFHCGFARTSLHCVLAACVAVSIALGLAVLLPTAGFADEQHIAINIQRGQTYTLKDLDPNATPAVTFSEHHPFTLQCPAPGICYVLGAEAGRGKVRIRSANGTTTVYDVTVSAVAQPGKPLEPGEIPSNGSAEKSSATALNSTDSISNTNPAVLYSEPSLDPGAAVTEKPTSHVKYSQNPVSKELEVPPASLIGSPAPRLPTLALMAGSSRLLDMPVALRRVSVADSRIADVQVIAPNQLMLIGHQAGFTTLVTWDQYGNYPANPC